METPEQTPEGLREAIGWFDDFGHCREFMMELRWPDGVVKCPRCDSEKVFWIVKERVWKCYGKHDHAKFSLKTGTIFEDSPIRLEKWLPTVWLLTNCKIGISSYEVHRALKVTQKTAWFMLHRVRLAMKSGTFTKLSGEVEADETFVGGKVRNMHKDRKGRMQKDSQKGNKTVVLGLLQRDGEVRAAVAPSRRKHQVHDQITENVAKGSKLYTDDFNSHDNLPEGYTRELTISTRTLTAVFTRTAW